MQAKSHGLPVTDINNSNNNYGSMLANSFLNKSSSPIRNSSSNCDISVGKVCVVGYNRIRASNQFLLFCAPL